jgi:hypothetical protein
MFICSAKTVALHNENKDFYRRIVFCLEQDYYDLRIKRIVSRRIRM